MINMTTLNKIVIKYKTDSDIIYMIQDTLTSMREYVNIIVQQEILVTTKKFTMEVGDYREEVVKLDTLRRTLHNEVISGVKFLNKLSVFLGLELFYNGDIHSRELVGECAFEYVEHSFKNRNNR